MAKTYPKALKIIISLLILFFFQQAIAQNSDSEMEKLFSSSKKIEHKSYIPKFSNKETNIYWVNNDTLYSCGQFYGGAKIALEDIDFAKKSIIKSRMLVENTADFMYQLNFYPQKGKPTFSYFCLGSIFISDSNKPDFDKMVTLDMANPMLAKQAFEYLQRLSKTANKKTLQIVPTTSNQVFDTQLVALINGLKDDFQSLKGKELEDKEYLSKVQLQSTVTTKIVTSRLRNDFVLASFGEFKTMKEAQDIYDKIFKKINDAKTPFTLIKQQEVITSMSRTGSWLPFGQLDPGLKGFSMILDIMKIPKLDKDYNFTDYWFVTLKIEK